MNAGEHGGFRLHDVMKTSMIAFTCRAVNETGAVRRHYLKTGRVLFEVSGTVDASRHMLFARLERGSLFSEVATLLHPTFHGFGARCLRFLLLISTDEMKTHTTSWSSCSVINDKAGCESIRAFKQGPRMPPTIMMT